MPTPSIIVFLGPSLSLAEAKTVLPQARWMPPVRCGDVLRISRLKPDIIVIIDGYFENTPAVWHKEILFALSQGIMVFGASSMGALRACELAPFGMRSYGQIATDFIEGQMQDDDEVALLHSQQDDVVHPNSSAMVNIRATLKYANDHHIIDDVTYTLLIDTFKTLHYRERHLLNTVNLLSHNTVYKNRLEKLIAWLKTHGEIDVKKQDALGLLTHIAKETLTPLQKLFTFNASNLFRGLYKNIACRPMLDDYPWLPNIERIALASRYMDETYLLIRRLAYLLSACYQLALDKESSKSDYPLNHILTKLNIDTAAMLTDADAARLDCQTEVYQAFIKRITMVLQLLAQARYQCNQLDAPENYLIVTMKMYDAYKPFKDMAGTKDNQAIIACFKKLDLKRYHLFHMIALTSWYINNQIDERSLTPHTHLLQKCSDQLRKRHQLFTIENLQGWLAAHDLTLESYEQMIISIANIHYFVIENQMDLLLSKLHEDNHWWFEDALYLSGYYEDAKKILEDKTFAAPYKKACEEKSHDENYLLQHDFIQ